MVQRAVKRFRVEELEPGMILGRTMHDEQGKVIMEAGQVILQEGSVLTRQWIDRLIHLNIKWIDIKVPIDRSPKSTALPVIVSNDDGPAREKRLREISGLLLAEMARGEKLSLVIERFVNEVARFFGTDHVFLSVMDGSPLRWWVIGNAGALRIPELLAEQKFMGGEYEAGRNVLIDDLSSHKVPSYLSRAEMLSLLGVPIAIRGKTLGVVELASHRSRAFYEGDMEALAFLARHIAAAIAITQSREECRQVNDEGELLKEVLQLLANQPSAEALASNVAEALSNFFSATGVAAFVVARNLQEWSAVEVFVRNFSRGDVERLKEVIIEKWPGGIRTGPFVSPTGLAVTGTRSFHMLPLFSRDVLQGVIVLFWDYEKRNGLSSRLEATLAVIASQSAIALERNLLYDRVEKIGFTDSLTGLPNRRMFDYVIERELTRCRRYGRSTSLMMVDIDFFKKINDTLGHQAGDKILSALGTLMKKRFRTLDVATRYGGEEFAVILPETESKEAVVVAEQFRALVEATRFHVGKDKLNITISIGVASLDPAILGEDTVSKDLIKTADAALYQAKKLGRNRVVAM